MTATILALLIALIPLLLWWLKRRAAKRDDPVQQHRDRYQQADTDIARGDGLAAGLHGVADLDELDRLSGDTRDQRRPGPGTDAGRQDLSEPG